MTSPGKKSDFIRQGDHRLLQELEHDPYHSKIKLKEPTVCPVCRAVYHKGRWQWAEIPENADEIMCPACHRIHDRVPAGFLTISGDFYAQHKDEIQSLIRNVEEREKAEHPLKRIMQVEEKNETVVYSFTDAHLARGIGDALHHAYQGELDYQYTNEDIMLRVNWSR
ncbi:MAG: BCAM0308 family protein [Gammaproteobacteria bacterium]|nr:MAG: BCAM0308 family protein [Gammaproteobacteria bacterium]